MFIEILFKILLFKGGVLIYAIYSLFVHLLSALNNFIPDRTVPAKYRSRFQNLALKFLLLKEGDRLTNTNLVCTILFFYFIHLVKSLEFIDFDFNLYELDYLKTQNLFNILGKSVSE